ncbi:cobyrinate a,c-diamide synthase [Saccharopolyspora phatthalungensis]|uniref:Hydrogenobyrinate a,c-diamide synthase n=1 Tax=Saccharopolyspora phatthalungensis TaxID=664693 RepID=A0A840QAA3_9PSEU|nr:cobyrinate a,c-diamide synthase [Saccharopolyspora phatthalungensis]MBB5155588.1 cobyrinic acid a,c-diamide synthase [Saccharopolyspora phatthalungensis]
MIVAAPASGQGKTTVVTGLLGAMRRRGTEVAPFKVGPDYIDPGYHRLAAGRPARNLDPVLVGEDRIAPLFRHGSAGAELSIVEGVMGLFDGRIGPGDGIAFGSTAHVAQLLNAPVVLVVDARGQSHSLAALLHGFRSYRPEVTVAGVILNRVASERHEQVLRDAADNAGLPVLGAIPRAAGLAVPSRHLGLVTAAEHGSEATRAVDAMTDIVARSVDLEAVRALACSATELPGAPWNPREEVEPQAGPVVAVAGGRAFTFAYAEHVELLEAAGAEVAVLDPLNDERLPERTAGLVLPGGFPEQYVAELSANTALRKEIAAFTATGAPVHAECGGLLYLAEELDGHPLCGVLDARARMSPRLTLGYRDAVAAADSVLFAEGARVSGHEFHRTVLEPGSGPRSAWLWRPAGETKPLREGFVHGGVHASYLHTHPAGQPGSVQRFVARCAG